MKHILLIRFLLLFNAWWMISWNVVVHANGNYSSPSSAPRTIVSGLNEMESTLKTIILEHLPNHTSQTTVIAYTSGDRSEGQSSENVTSEKPVDKSNNLTSERRLSSVTVNVGGHSSMTTEWQENSGSRTKTSERKSTFEPLNNRSISNKGAASTTIAHSIDVSSVSRMNYSDQNNHTVINDGHVSNTKSRFERSVDQNVTNQVTGATSASEESNTVADDLAKTSDVSTWASTTQTSLLHSQSTIPTTSFPREDRTTVIAVTVTEDRSEGQSSEQVTSEKPVDKSNNLTSERSLSSLTGNVGGHSSMTTERQENNGSGLKTNESKSTFEPLNNPSNSNEGTASSTAAHSMNVSSVSRMNYSDQNNHTVITDDHVSKRNSRIERSVDQNVTRQVTVATSANENNTFAKDNAKISDVSIESTTRTSLLQSQSTIPTKSFPREGHTIVVIYTSEGQSSEQVTSGKPVDKAKVHTEIDLSGVTGNVGGHYSMTTERQAYNDSRMKTDERKSTFVPLNNQSISIGEVVTLSTYSMDVSNVSRMNYSDQNNHTVITDDHISNTKSRFERSVDQNVTRQLTGATSANKNNTFAEDLAKTSDVSMASTTQTSLLRSQSTIPTTSFPREGHTIDITYTSEDRSEGQSSENVTSEKPVDKANNLTSEGSLSSLTGNVGGHSSMTTERQENNGSRTKTSETKNTFELLNNQSISKEEAASTAAHSMDVSSVSRIDYSDQNNHTVITDGHVSNTKSRIERSVDQNITRQVTGATSASENNTFAEDQAKTSDVSMESTTQTSLLHSQSTIPTTSFPQEGHTIVVIYTSEDQSEGQSSEQVTSGKPVDKAKVHTEINLSGVTGNVGGHSSMTTVRQAYNDSRMKTDERKSTFVPLNNQSISIGEVVTLSTYSMDVSNVSRMNYSDQNNHTVKTDDHISNTKSRFERSADQNVTKQVTDATSANEKNTFAEDQAKTSDVSMESTAQTSLLHSQSTIPSTLLHSQSDIHTTPFPLEGRTTVISYTSEDQSDGQSSEQVTSGKPDDKARDVTSERSLSSLTGNVGGHSSMTTERQENNDSRTKTSERKSTFELLNNQSISNEGTASTAAHSMDVSSVSRMNYSEQNNHTVITGDRISNTKSRFERSADQNVTRQVTGATSANEESNTFAEDLAMTSDVSMESTAQTSLLHSQSTIPTSLLLEGRTIVVVYTSEDQSEGQSSEQVTSGKPDDKAKDVTSERSLSSVTGTVGGQFNVTTGRQENNDSGLKTNERKLNEGAASTAAYFVDVSSVSRMNYSEQNDDTAVTSDYVSTAESRLETSVEQEVSMQVTDATSASEENTFAEDQAMTSDVLMESTTRTSLLHSQSTIPTTFFSLEDLLAPINITSVNVTDTSVTLRWCQGGLLTNLSVTEVDRHFVHNQCLGDISNETISRESEFCNWTWMSYVISDLPKSGAVYNSTIHICVLDRCENASHTFQTAPAQPDIKDFKVGTHSINMSWTQKGTIDKFDIWVSDPLAKISLTPDNKTGMMTVWGSIDQLSTPGQLLTVTITALRCNLKSKNLTKHFNTKPSAPGPLVMFDCYDNNLCMQWNQSGIFDSYVIRVNGSEANVSCWNSSVTALNLTTVNCTVYHFVPSGSSTALYVAVKSGSKMSDEMMGVYLKKPAKPEGVHAMRLNASTVCFSWNQSGSYDEFDIRISLSNHSYIYQENWTIPMYSDGLMLTWCVNELPCPGSMYSLHIATVSHGKKSDFQKLPFRSAVDYTVTCASQTNESFELSIQPNTTNESCPSFEDVERIVYTYQPMDNESCSNSWDINAVFNATRNITTVSGLIAGVNYQVKVWAVIDGIKNEEQVIHCPTKPNPPSGIHIVNVSSTNMILTWNPPEGCVAGFLVECIGQNNSLNYSTTVKEANATCENLTPGSRYNVMVRSRLTDNTSSEAESLQFVTEPAKPEGVHVTSFNTSTVCFSWNQSGSYEKFDIRISPPNNSSIFQENSTIRIHSNGLMPMCCVTGLLCPGAMYSLHIATVSQGNKSDFHNLHFRSAVDYTVMCASQKNESFELSVQPNMTNESCPSFEDVERIMYTYQPVDNESCSISSDVNAVLKATRNFTTVSGLIAGVNYQVKVWAVIDGIKNEEQVIHCTTKPNPPSGLNIPISNVSSMMLIWTSPEGCVADFLVDCIGQNGALNDSQIVKEANVTCENLTAGALYNVTVRSRLTDNTSSEAKSLQFVTVPMSPSKVRVEENFVDSFKLSVDYNTEWKCTHFHFECDGINVTIPCKNRIHKLTLPKSNTCYNIRVSTISNYSGNVPKTSVDPILVSNWTLPLSVSNLSITSATVNSLTLEWIQPDKSIIGIHGYNLTIWNGSEYPQNISLNCSSNVLNCTIPAMTYELRNLTPNTNYTITIRALNMGGVSDKQVIVMQTQQDIPDKEFSLALVGIIACVAVTFILILFVLAFVLRKKTKFAVPSARRPSDGMGFQNPTFTPDICESMKPKPIPLEDFIEHLDELHNDSDLRFSSEYAMLTEMSPKHPQTASEMEENRTKNRYSNILPFDHSRVKLIPLDDDDQGSDYINANFMPGYVSKREFIAAQGPMKSTVDDFWRMIWEQNITTIVMVTNLQERGREKCAEYWPMDDEPVFYGDLQVQMKSESQLNYYIIRILDVKLGEKKRIIKHLHFISWPDFGCPENTAVLLDFVLGVRAHAPSQPLQGSGPILVHCSAGVGRTGTFILVDHLLQRMRNHRSLDIFGIVLEMRNYRCNMLQTEAQYVFAHECIKTAIERQMISNMNNSIAEEDEDDECMYQNVGGKGKLEEEEECVYQNCTKENMKGFPV